MLPAVRASAEPVQENDDERHLRQVITVPFADAGVWGDGLDVLLGPARSDSRNRKSIPAMLKSSRLSFAMSRLAAGNPTESTVSLAILFRGIMVIDGLVVTPAGTNAHGDLRVGTESAYFPTLEIDGQQVVAGDD